jgi:translation elongation factor EF-Tu-like GTPase
LSWTSTICKKYVNGAAQMEGAILVVAVNDGPQVQTRDILF